MSSSQRFPIFTPMFCLKSKMSFFFGVKLIIFKSAFSLKVSCGIRLQKLWRRLSESKNFQARKTKISSILFLTLVCRVYLRLIQSGFSHVFVVYSEPIEIVWRWHLSFYLWHLSFYLSDYPIRVMNLSIIKWKYLLLLKLKWILFHVSFLREHNFCTNWTCI